VNSYQVKKQSSLPPWLEENKAVVGILGGTLVLVLGVLLFGLRNNQPVATGPIHQGELVIVMGPVKTWEEGSTTRLKGVQLKIKNRGRALADGVVVSGSVRGVPVALKGKSHLAPGEIGDYSATFEMVVLSSDAMDFKAECPSCAPFVPPAK
jgi:S1-C subfamily serine protease